MNHIHPRQIGGELLAPSFATLVGGDGDALRCGLGGAGECLGLIEEPGLIGMRLRREVLLRRATEELAFKPAVLFLKQLDALFAGRQPCLY